MKQIKNLKADWIDLNTMIKNKEIEIRRLKALESWLIQNVPDYINGTYNFSNVGETCIRCFIDLKKDEQNTINLLKWLSELKKKKWEIRKFWREEDGYFSYWAKREMKYGFGISYIILFENSANIDGCVITQKKVMKKIFVTDCEKESVIF